MKALVLNLAHETARLALQRRQLTALGLTFERIPAVTPHSLTPPPDAPYWSRWERPLRVTEMAALASHRHAWQHIAAGREPALVLEDDAWLMPATPAFLDTVARLDGIDHITLEVRSRRKLVDRRAHPTAPMRRLWQDRTGAAAYILWPSGAAKLLARIHRRPALADAVLCAAYELSSWQADPALAIQIDQCPRYGIQPPLAVTSTIAQAPRPDKRALPTTARLGFTRRRLASQLRMGLRYLRRAPASQRRHITLANPA